MTLEEAGQKAIQDGFEPFVCGEGNNVVAQVPQAGSKIPRGGRVVLFTTQNSTSETTIVPDMVGMSVEQVNETAAEYNINVSFSGSVEQEGILSYAQSINPRERVAPGTVVTVYFGNNDIDDTVM